MILICKSNKASKNTVFENLTPNKSYQVTTYERLTYLVRDDSGETAIYPRKCFFTKREIRDNTIDTILNKKS